MGEGHDLQMRNIVDQLNFFAFLGPNFINVLLLELRLCSQRNRAARQRRNTHESDRIARIHIMLTIEFNNRTRLFVQLIFGI